MNEIQREDVLKERGRFRRHGVNVSDTRVYFLHSKRSHGISVVLRRHVYAKTRENERGEKEEKSLLVSLFPFSFGH